jgi:hypothetical protein
LSGDRWIKERGSGEETDKTECQWAWQDQLNWKQSEIFGNASGVQKVISLSDLGSSTTAEGFRSVI